MAVELRSRSCCCSAYYYYYYYYYYTDANALVVILKCLGGMGHVCPNNLIGGDAQTPPGVGVLGQLGQDQLTPSALRRFEPPAPIAQAFSPSVVQPLSLSPYIFHKLNYAFV